MAMEADEGEEGMVNVRVNDGMVETEVVSNLLSSLKFSMRQIDIIHFQFIGKQNVRQFANSQCTKNDVGSYNSLVWSAGSPS